MRKLLLATTALVAFAGAAQAAESPIQVTVGGYVDFRAAQFSETDNQATDAANRSYDMDTEYKLEFAAEGKAANGVAYGALISLTNDTDYVAAGGNTLVADQGYVWMSGAFGKVELGDAKGASNLFVYAPTVGQEQIDGNYANYVNELGLIFTPIYVSSSETDTKVSYYTPKVGNDAHKIQLGVSYTVDSASNGTDAVIDKVQEGNYNDMIEAVAQYTGTFSPVTTVVSAGIVSGDTSDVTAMRDYLGFGIGAQAMYEGFTLGGSYANGGDIGTVSGESKTQDVWSGGLKYEMDKVALAVNGLKAQGYDNGTYIKDYSALGFGATYTWFPGLTTAADAVFFDQEIDGARSNEGHVLLLSQKLTF